MPPRDRTPRPGRPSGPRPSSPRSPEPRAAGPRSGAPRSKAPRSAEPQRTPVVRSALANVGGAVTTRGDASHAAALGEAMQAADHSPPDVATHGMHAYPARMHAAIATHVIERLTKPGARVVDPFCGSGTVLVEAMTLGRRSAGVDLNPLAIRIAEVKTTRVDAVRRERLAMTIEGLGERSEERVRTRTHTQAPLTPEDAKWYEGHTLKELAGLHAEIAALENEDDRRLLEMLFSAIVVKFSIQRAETTERVAERRIRKGLPTEFFVRRGMEWLDRWAELEVQIAERAPAEVFVPRLVQGDARKLREHVGAAPVDLVLSSPPYGGTYDYVHHHVRRYPWLGIDPTQLERNELGARRDLNQSRMHGQDPADLWDDQVVAMLKGMRKVVRPGSHIVLLVGDGQLGEERVAADRQLEGLAPARAPRGGGRGLAAAAGLDRQGGAPRAPGAAGRGQERRERRDRVAGEAPSGLRRQRGSNLGDGAPRPVPRIAERASVQDEHDPDPLDTQHGATVWRPDGHALVQPLAEGVLHQGEGCRIAALTDVLQGNERARGGTPTAGSADCARVPALPAAPARVHGAALS
jgi:hypothetical protein